MELVPPSKKFNTIPGLDSLRFFAFLTVFLSHSIFFLGMFKNTQWEFLTPYLTIGDLGVSAFFILSGFLITSLLITEKNNTQTISLKNFYIRRSLRIWPLYFLIVFLGIVVIPLIVPANIFPDPYTVNGTGAIWKLFTFTFNFGQSDDFISLSLVLGVLWSLSVEEQFYIVWPWVAKYLSKNKLLIATIAVITLSILARVFFVHDRSFIEYNTLSVMGDIALGGLLGFAFNIHKKVFEKITTRGAYGYFFAGLIAILIIIVLRPHLREKVLFTIFEPLLFSIGIMILITGIISSSSLLTHRITVFLGKISYGLYMYHIIAMILVLLVSRYLILLSQPIIIVGSFFTTIILATGSYYYFEQPFLKLKSRFK